MKIVQYCQHVLGVGHLFRSLEISRALSGHDVLLVTGGEPMHLDLPVHVRSFQLPPLKMDETFSQLQVVGAETDLDRVRDARRDLLWDLMRREAPDLFLVELYPFGRKAFRFELDPVLEGLRTGRLPRCPVACSIRDILVEKRDADRKEQRVVEIANRYFDRVLVHADPRIVRLEETFGRFHDLRVPVTYTGFVAPEPPPTTADLRAEIGVSDRERFVVVSAGAGQVGWPLLEAAVRAAPHLAGQERFRMQVYTGPFLADDRYASLQELASASVRVDRFTPDFQKLLTAADLSVSMGGYNTTMNILAARAPALVWPFPQNREQRMRADRLEAMGLLGVLSDGDLDPARLAARMSAAMERGRPEVFDIRIDGAAETADILTQMAAS